MIALAVTASLASGAVAISGPSADAAPLRATSATPSAGEYGSPGQGPVIPVSGSSSRPSAGAVAATAPTLTRSQVIQRAKGWVGLGLDYDQGASHAGYRTDCSGYVSMAWQLSSSLTTDTFASAGVTTSIAKGSLKPGDALLNSSSGNSGHVVLFDKWIDGAQSSYMGYEFTGTGVHYREIPYPYYTGHGTFSPVRNTSVIDDATPPTDPGMTDLTAGDFNADGKRDLVAVQVSTGKLFLYPGTGSGTLASRVEIGDAGWNGMADLTVGDLNRDGKDDLIATQISTGNLWLYPGTGTGTDLGTRVLIGTGGWNGMANLFSGDFTGDGHDDLGAVQTSTGKLVLYPGTGTGIGTRVEIGNAGWNGMGNVVNPGDMNGDGKDDLVATQTSSGNLVLYRGHGDGTIDGASDRTTIGTGGWNGVSDYTGGDFDGDDIGDVVAVVSQPGATGNLYLYKGTGGNELANRIEIGNAGW